jgi:Uma2 family endonuclease
METTATHRFTVEEFHRMDGAGVFQDKRVELIEGSIIDMAPIGFFHGGSSNRLNWLFGEPAAKGRWIVSLQNSIALSEESEPQPDLMLLKPSPSFYTDRLPIPEDVLLLVEISHSTLTLDRDVKIPLYGQAGIVEVWIINLQDKQLEVHREPHYTGYASVTVLQAGQKVSPLLFPDIKLNVGELIKQGA